MVELTLQTKLRPGAERGRTNMGWLRSWHSFTFGGYQDPTHRGFRALRVINEDFVAPGHGFDEHPHRDAEIISLVLEGQLQHRDSLGNGRTLGPGDLQYMSAGEGVRHSEFNPSAEREVHFLQIWILPDADRSGGAPVYAEQSIRGWSPEQPLRPLFSDLGVDGGPVLRASAEIQYGRLLRGGALRLVARRFRHGWLQMIRGSVHAAEVDLQGGDGLAFSGDAPLEIAARGESEFLLFGLA